jgi:hypothetical protein
MYISDDDDFFLHHLKSITPLFAIFPSKEGYVPFPFSLFLYDRFKGSSFASPGQGSDRGVMYDLLLLSAPYGRYRLIMVWQFLGCDT